MASSDTKVDRLAALTPERRALLEKRLRGGRGAAPPVGAIPRRRAGEPVPLSFAQRRLWFLEQLAPGNPFYNIPLNIRLAIPVNVAALQRAINEIVRRHEALRTTFRSQDGSPRQLVAGQVEVPLPVIDIRALAAAERDGEALRLATLEAQQPFDLESGPLIRTALVQLGDADFLLLLSIHHIVADGWSMGVFSRELSALYSAYALGWPATLPELPIQYGDFAVWQRGWLTGDVLDEQLGYWSRTLADLPALQLPTDRPRPPVQAFRGAYHPFALDRERSERLRALSRAHGVTLFMTLTAAFTALLHRYTAQTDIVIGTPIANRTRRELEPIIGFFVNSLVLRTDLAGDPTFVELLHRVRDVALGAYAHQDLPFEALVEHLQPSRDPSRNPLFQVTFQLFTPQADGTAAEGVSAGPVAIQRGTAIFDIAFTLIDAGGELRGGFEYDTDLFDPATIERMGTHLVSLLMAAAAAPDCRVSALPLLTPAERQRLLVEWNTTSADFPTRLLDELVSERAALDPAAIAVVAPEGCLSRRELEQRATALAGCLQHHGVTRADLVAVALDRSLDMVVAILATLKAGAAYVPLDPSYPPSRLGFMLRDSRARVLITGSTPPAALEPGDATVIRLAGDRTLASAPPLRPVEGRHPDDLAYVIYTSGSTGRPKGVGIPHRAIGNHMHWMQERFPLTSADRVLQRTPFSFDASVWEFYAPLLSGAQLVMAEAAGSKDPGYLVEAIRDRGVTILQLVPSLLEMLLAQPAFDRALPLRRVFCGGEPLPPHLVQRFHERFDAELCNLYGPTEAAIDSTYWVSPGPPVGATIPIGRPIANAEIYILDPHGEPVPVGVPGELHIGGAGLACGYLNQPELTRQRFVANPFRPAPSARLYRTGDLARYRADGTIEFLGRLDHQVKLRGYRIELGEIESALRQHPAVRDTVVVCRGDDESDRRLAAYVVTDSGRDAAALPQVSDAQVERWRQVFDETHHHHQPVDPRFNIVGWNSSYTGLPIPADEMRETVEATLARLTALRPKRVLEIGCGTGLLLLPLAPRCETYVGTDFSPVTLDGLAEVIGGTGATNVRLLLRAADDTSGLGTETFDLVILNSVVQYFPDAAYLARVLRQVAPHIAPGGALFVGDVRNLTLLDALHTSVELAQAPPDLPVSALRQRVDLRAAQEQELVLAPEFFSAVAAEIPGCERVDVLLKRGRHHNELTRFRYDAIIHVGGGGGHPDAAVLDEWPAGGLTAGEIQARLAASPRGVIGFADVPNARVVQAAGAARALARAADAWTAARVQAEATAADGVDPELFFDAAESVGGSAHAQWSLSGRPDTMDVTIASTPDALPAFPRRPVPRNGYAHCANEPLQGAFVRNLAPDLRRHLQALLPDYMMPATFTLLGQLPLGPHGKIDRTQLPSPDPLRARQGAYIAPRGEVEERLARLWSEVLAVPQIDRRDNFFTELGGHSLLGTQLMSRVRSAFGIDLPLSRLFSAPTIADLAVHVQAALGAGDASAAPAAMSGGDLSPIGAAALSTADLELIARAMQSSGDDTL